MLLDEIYQVEKVMKKGNVKEFGLAIKPNDETKEIKYIKQENCKDLEKLYEDYCKLIDIIYYLKDYNEETRTQIEKIKLKMKRVFNYNSAEIVLGGLMSLCGISYFSTINQHKTGHMGVDLAISVIDLAIFSAMPIGVGGMVSFEGIKQLIATSKYSDEEKERLIKQFESIEMNEEEINDSNAYYYIKTK